MEDEGVKHRKMFRTDPTRFKVKTFRALKGLGFRMPIGLKKRQVADDDFLHITPLRRSMLMLIPCRIDIVLVARRRFGLMGALPLTVRTHSGLLLRTLNHVTITRKPKYSVYTHLV